MNVTATVTRVGKWWAIDIPDVNGTAIHSQAHSLSEVNEMAADAVSLVTGIAASKVVVEAHVALTPKVRAHIKNAAKLRERADQAQTKASAEARAAAKELKNAGYTLRDIGEILEISHQRAHQLVKS